MVRVFTVSDLHIDYDENRRWLYQLSSLDYQDDVLLLAGDLTDRLDVLEGCLRHLGQIFRQVIFVPGNHELWVRRDNACADSMMKFSAIRSLANDCGIAMNPVRLNELSIVPMLAWYDFSFGPPTAELRKAWTDFRHCRWPSNMNVKEITQAFLLQNLGNLHTENTAVISFSHFLPRIDLMPNWIPERYRYIYPVLGSLHLEEQVRILEPDIHVYGHSHVNRQVLIDGVRYINNAFGYPSEKRITAKQLLCVHVC